MRPHASPILLTPASLRRAITHLRLPFSVVLTPLFVWGVYLATPRALDWVHVLLAYLIVHVPLYGGMNAFNSYYDRDDGPIGALLDPPPVDHTVLTVALLCKLLALLGGLLLDLRFGALVAVGVAFSVVYSHPLVRLKERPILAALSIFLCQGVLGVLWGWVAADRPPANGAALWPTGASGTLATLGAAGWTLGFYPLTGAYQIAADRRNNVRTLAVALGVDGSFLFAAVVAPLGGLGVWATLVGRGAYPALVLSALYVGGAFLFTWRWYRRFATLSDRQSQRTLMRLSYANGVFFSILFFALVLLGAQ